MTDEAIEDAAIAIVSYEIAATAFNAAVTAAMHAELDVLRLRLAGEPVPDAMLSLHYRTMEEKEKRALRVDACIARVAAARGRLFAAVAARYERIEKEKAKP